MDNKKVLNHLIEFLAETYSADELFYLSRRLHNRAEEKTLPPLTHVFTKEEINKMLDEAERDFEEGKGIPDEEVWREFDEEFGPFDTELPHLQKNVMAAEPKEEYQRMAV
ncbi:MAG: hypothetical protein IKR94_01600 [Bacteroidales bacterium]|nr:hypothetical protein [Bacteroidales bacterium]